MFHCVNNLVVVGCSNSDTDTIDLYTWRTPTKTRQIATDISSTTFHQHLDTNGQVITNRNISTNRLTIDHTDGKTLTIYHHDTIIKTTAKVGYEHRLIITPSLIGLDYLTSINGMNVIKICIPGGKYDAYFLTQCGKIYRFNSFDSDVVEHHDLNLVEFIVPTIVADIECTYSQITVLTNDHLIYKIYLNNEIEKPLYQPQLVDSIPPISEIKCQHYRTIYRCNRGKFYADEIMKCDYDDDLVEITALSNFAIVKFDCTNYYVVAMDDNDDLYSVGIEEYGESIDSVPHRFDHKVFPMSETPSIKSARKY